MWGVVPCEIACGEGGTDGGREGGTDGGLRTVLCLFVCLVCVLCMVSLLFVLRSFGGSFPSFLSRAAMDEIYAMEVCMCMVMPVLVFNFFSSFGGGLGSFDLAAAL